MPAPHRMKLRRCSTGLAALALALVLAGCDSSEEKAQNYFQRAMASMTAGELDKAALDFRNVLKLDENHTDALLALAQLEEARGNFEAAVRLYSSVAQQDSQHLDSRIRLAQIFLASGQTDAASNHAEQANRLKPADPRVIVIRAGVALSRGKLADAARLANEALRLSPKDSTARMMLVTERIAADDPAGALKIIEQGLADDASDLGLQVMKLRTLQGMGDQPGIEKQFIRLTQQFPDNPVFHDGLVIWYVDQRRDIDAERAARHFAQAHPADETAQIKLAFLLSRTQGAPAALAELKSIIESFPAPEEARLVSLRIAQAQLEDLAGQPESAVATLRDLVAAMKDKENRKLAQVRLAQALSATKQWKEAAELSEAVLAEDARNADALTVRASVRLAQGDNARAVEDLVAAQGQAPNAANVALLLGEGHERMGASALAEEQYTRALTLSGYAPAPGVKLAQFMMRYGRAARAIEVLEDLRASGTADLVALSLLGQLKLNTRDWTGAEEIAGALRKMDVPGKDEAADQLLAAALGGMDRQGESLDLLQARLSQSPDGKAAKTELVGAHVRAGNLAEAERLAREQLQANPSDARSHVLLGSVMAAAGRPEDAETAFKTAAAGGKGSAQGNAALAHFYLRRGQFDKAEQAARSGLEREPDISALRLLLAEILEARGAFDDAIVEYEQLLQSDPTATVVANNLASLLSERSGDPKALERALSIANRFHNSDVPQFLDTLGWIHYLRGDYFAALPLLTRAAEKLPNSATVQFHLGMALKEVGQAELSARSLEQAVKLAAEGKATFLTSAIAALEELKSNQLAN